MKHILAPIVLALASMSALAQDAAPAQPAAAPAAERPGAANPFTGKPLSAEALQRELELRKLQSQLLEEQLRALSLEEDARYVATRKQAEAAASTTALARERVAQSALERELNAAKTPPPARPDAAIRNQGKAKPKAEEAKETVTPRVAAPVRPNINVLSVLHTGGKRSAMLEIGTDIVSVEDGQSTPYGVVRVTDQGVRLDNQSLAVNDATIGRVRRSEADQAQVSGGMRMPATGPARGVDQSSASPAVSQLPPLVLPPTVRTPTAAPGQAVTGGQNGAAVVPAMPSPTSIR